MQGVAGPFAAHLVFGEGVKLIVNHWHDAFKRARISSALLLEKARQSCPQIGIKAGRGNAPFGARGALKF